MSIIDDLRAGFKDGDFNDAPFYPGAAWYAKLPLNTASTVGLTPFGYVQKDEFTTEKIFDFTIDEVTENSSVFALLTAEGVKTSELLNFCTAIANYGVIEDATGEKHLLYSSEIPVYLKVL